MRSMFKPILALIFHWELADQVCAAFPRLTLLFRIQAMPDLLQQVAQGQGSQAEREQVFAASECALVRGKAFREHYVK